MGRPVPKERKEDRTLAWRALAKKVAADVNSLPSQVRRAGKLVLIWLLVLIVLLNPLGSGLITSLKNQELFSYHLTDLMAYADHGTQADEDYYYLSTGTYEEQKDGPLFAAAKGKNLIVIQVESFQNIMVDLEYDGQEVTPNLNQLLREQGTLYFDHYYQELGSGNTSDSEFATNNSLLGSIESYTYKLYNQNYYKGLPFILKENGYSTAVFHGYDKNFWNRAEMYPRMGFDQFYDSDYFKNDNLIGVDGGNIPGISDTAFFQQSMKALKELPQPFYAFMVTLSSHHPFQLPAKLSGLRLMDQDQGTLVGDYLNAAHYADQSLGVFLDELKESGLYDESVICVYGDHFGLPPTDEDVEKRVSQLIGRDYRMDVAMNIPLIIHLPQRQENLTYDITAGEVDFMPTICSLLGVETLDTLYLGQNLLTAKEGFVYEQTHLLKGSFFNDQIVFEMSRDGVFDNSEAYERDSDRTVDFSQYEDQYLRAKQMVELSNFYLQNDVLKKALVDKLSMEEILSGSSDETVRPSVLTYAGAPDWDGKTIEEALTSSQKAGFDYLIVSGTMDQEDASRIYYEDLIDWLERNRNTTVLLELEGEDVVEILRAIREADDSMTARIIPILHSMDYYTKTEYEGYHNILFMPDPKEYGRKDLANFILLNEPWAVAIPAAQADTTFRNLLSGDVFLYAYPVEDAAEKARLTSLGVDGFISETVKTLLLP